MSEPQDTERHLGFRCLALLLPRKGGPSLVQHRAQGVQRFRIIRTGFHLGTLSRLPVSSVGEARINSRIAWRGRSLGCRADNTIRIKTQLFNWEQAVRLILRLGPEMRIFVEDVR